MEVIAKRKDDVVIGFALGLGFLAVSFVVFLICIKLVGKSSPGNSSNVLVTLLMVCVLFVPIIGILIWRIVKFQKTPKVPIVFENGKINFRNWFECAPAEIESVNYQQARGGKYGRYTYQWGKLTVNAKGQKITYDYIEDVVAVHDRLIALMMESRERK